VVVVAVAVAVVGGIPDVQTGLATTARSTNEYQTSACIPQPPQLRQLRQPTTTRFVVVFFLGINVGLMNESRVQTV